MFIHKLPLVSVTLKASDQTLVIEAIENLVISCRDFSKIKQLMDLYYKIAVSPLVETNGKQQK